MAKKFTIDTKYTKTYINVKNMEKAVAKMNLPDSVHYIECWTEDGRVTAVFTNISCNDNGHFTQIAHNGFKVMG